MPDVKLLPQFYVTIGGGQPNVELSADLLDITIESSLSLPDVATLSYHDLKAKWLDDANLTPGKEVKITTKVENNENEIFKGELVEIEPDFRPGHQRLIIRAFDKMHRLARGRHVRTFVNVTDGDIVKKLTAEVGLSASCDPTNALSDYVLQANETNHEFLIRRASALGFLIYVDDSTLHFKKPAADAPAVELKWGETLLEFRPRLSTLDQINKSVARGWDPKAKREVVGQATTGNGAPEIGERKKGGAMAQSAFGITAEFLTVDRVLRDQAVADVLAVSVANMHESEYVQADGVAHGNPKIVAGTPIEIKNLGTRFSGKYLVTQCKHRYTVDQGYTTEFTVSGQSPSDLITILAKSRETPLGERLVIGVVTDNNDPDKLGRVKVKYPWLSSDQASHWARVVSPGAGNARGCLWVPEVDDEVLVGFELGDMDHAYVLGGLWNGKDKPPGDMAKVVARGKVEQRILWSRTGQKITLDDSNDALGVKIEDSHGNLIQLETKKDQLNVKTKGDIVVEAKGNVKVDSKADVSIKATGSIKLEATGQVEIKGLSVTVEGNSMVEVKGSVVNIN